ncbi:MAG TPA: sigma-70 family RNA polymerase sigma factor [Pseudonocardiaceae bacterium]|jgi:RNA polymerase sigma-70 factor (ECF subfamily)|nr:sigma-70 family RNA polymerase sigma factor [Pseudonocardiaceae bacterium]
MNGAARASGIRLSRAGRPNGGRTGRRAAREDLLNAPENRDSAAGDGTGEGTNGATLDAQSVTTIHPKLTGELLSPVRPVPEVDEVTDTESAGNDTEDGETPDEHSGGAWELVRAAQEGDAGAFGRLYDRYVDVVFRYVLFRVGDRSLAEDVTSETFLRAFRRINSVSYQGRDVGAWFVTIARNIVLDHVKSSRFRLEVSTADPDDGRAVAAGPEAQVLANIEHTELLRCVEQLGDDQRECIVLRFLQGLSVAETAEVMDRNAGAIKALQHRAVRRLAQLLRAEPH